MARDRLFAVEASYYAAKIRAYLMCKGIAFEELLADRAAFDEFILPRVGYPIVPVIITAANETLQDTAEMIDYYESSHAHPVLIPREPRRFFVTYLLELLADEWIKLPALHYRWAYCRDYAIEMMGRNNDPDMPNAERRRVGEKIAREFSAWPEKLGVDESNRRAVEASYETLLSLLNTHFEQVPYLLGSHPTMGDCAFTGPFYAHLFLDPYPGEIMRERAPAVCEWVQRMRKAEPVSMSIIEPSDDIPKTLEPIIRHCAKEYVPVLTTAVPLLQAWLGNNPNGEIPRYVGKHRFGLTDSDGRECLGVRAIAPFEGWKVQRFVERIRSMDDSACNAAISYASTLGVGELFDLNFPNRLTRHQFRLVRESKP